MQCAAQAGWKKLMAQLLRLLNLFINHKQEIGNLMFSVDIATDARALHEVIISPMEPKPSDPGCLIWLKYLREMHQRKIMRRAIWTSTVDMLGDG